MNLYLPTLTHWLHRNQWTGSLGKAQYYILPRPDEDIMDAELWLGPLSRPLCVVDVQASFPITDDGVEALRQWLIEQSALINSR